MANNNNEIQNNQIVDLNTYAVKYFNEKDDIVDNPITLLNIESRYYDIAQLGGKLNTGLNKQDTHEFTSMHLNIQSLPAKFDNLKATNIRITRTRHTP